MRGRADPVTAPVDSASTAGASFTPRTDLYVIT